jgi:geranylgeranyl diphosphate synthase type I
MSESDELASVDLYFEMIGRKTAALIAASIEAGAVLATTDESVIARYRAFGWALGLAFQLNDDLLGIWGAEQSTGKEASDVSHKKQTLPVIYALEHAGPEDRERLLELYATTDPTRGDLDEIVTILERTGAREYTRDQARRYRDEALAELDAAGVVQPAARQRLEEIIVSVISA